MALSAMMQPDSQTSERARGDVGRDSILRSYLLMRTGVGLLGAALPALLLFGDWLFMEGTPSSRGSLSAYYYSGMRDVFVGILFAIAPLLISYKLFERNRDNLLSLAAGIFALGVALFPTGAPAGSTTPLSLLQERIGADRVEAIHFGCAALFILCLMLICYEFSKREAERPQQRLLHRARFSPRFWKWFHRTAAATIALAVLFILVSLLVDAFDGYGLLIGETVVCIAFGVSWFMKGFELDVLRPRLP